MSSRCMAMIVNSDAPQILLFADLVVNLVQTCLLKWATTYTHNHKTIWANVGVLLFRRDQLDTAVIVANSM